MLDRTSNNISFSTRDDMGDTVARVNDGSGQRAVRDLVGGPGGGKCEHRLDRDVQTLDVERFEKDLCGLFSILGCI